MDQLSGQIQALNDTMDELKVRLAKVSKQLEDMQSTQQSMAASQQATQAQAQAQAQAPPPDVLYANAFAITTAGITIWRRRNSPTMSSFIRIPISPEIRTSTSGNCSSGRQLSTGRDHYDQVLQNFPSGNKAASAQLKKGFALIEMGQKDDGVKELRHLIQRYPKTNEALQARERLKKLGVTTATRPGE